MPNTQTSVPAFTSGQVLTAQQQTEINTGIPVFATTVTRDAAFGGTGEKTLAEGQFAYIEATNATQYYDGAAWQPVASSGLTLISTGTMTAVGSVTVNTCFTATYDEYLLLVDVTGTVSATLTMQIRNAGSTITAANYQRFRTGFDNAGSADNSSALTQTSWLFGYLSVNTANASVFQINLFDPLTSRQHNASAFGVSTNAGDSATAVYSTGLRYNAAQAFDSFVLTASAGTMTGTVRVYGYSK